MNSFGTGTKLSLRSRFYCSSASGLLTLVTLAGCSLLVTRPVQEMSDTAAAIKAAKDVQADVRAPELYRQANEWFTHAKSEYKLKNFDVALDDANKARHFAEEAEYEVLKNGGDRGSEQIPDTSDQNAAPAETASPYPYPTPTGTMATDFPPGPVQTNSPGGNTPSPTPGLTGMPHV
jgi:hypothetical protein